MKIVKFLFTTTVQVIIVLMILNSIHSFCIAGTTGKITGKVVTVDTKEPLPGANVMIEGTTMGAATDIDGDFFIINIPPGNYQVRASMMGYTSLLKTGVRVSSNHTTTVNFQLEETVLEVGEAIVIEAERPLVEVDETSTRHYVEAKEIASRPARQLSEILTTLPGIDESGGELVVRRGSLDQVSFLIDGIRARNPLDFQPYQNINLTAIQELEVITGGFNAEYGEAQSGVFNIVTKEGGDNFEGYAELRWTPPGVHHWGSNLYDYSTTRYWENTHARHLQWWIDNPDQWVDETGIYGNDPNVTQTPEQAYQNYINTHQPLTDYTKRNTYQTELSLGGPLLLKNLYFFVSAKYREAPPVTPNSYRKLGTWYDGTAKLTYRLNDNMKLMLSGFYGQENISHGMTYMELDFRNVDKYVYYDWYGLPERRTDGQILKFTHVLGANTFYELELSRLFEYRAQTTFPGDDDGWDTGTTDFDNLRAKDSTGTEVPDAYNNPIGLHSTGYIYRGEDRNTDITFSGDITSQINKNTQVKGGFDFTYYVLDRFQEAKFYSAIEDEVYHPYEGNIYIQGKLEFQGLIMNLGFRYDFYNPNDRVYTDIFDPFDLIKAEEENRAPNPKSVPTSTFGQLSPRIGISHPISDKTVLHFSYGHFFQRANFGDYGEGIENYVSGILNTYLSDPAYGVQTPYNLGNRELKPRKTVAFELGLERNFNGLILDITGFYKDITKTIRDVKIIMYNNTSYLTTGNSDYADAKGIEVQVRKPLRRYWGGYLNYTWSTGIGGTSGDPNVIAAPGTMVQAEQLTDIGDYIEYDPSRLKFGITLATPAKFSVLGGILSRMQFAIDYQIYFPHSQIPSDNYRGEYAFIRPADKNANVRLRKEISIFGLRPSLFIEIDNVFNDKWINFSLPMDEEARVRFINSNMNVFPETEINGTSFPDFIRYRNLPRQIVFGFAVGF
ncbi:TonB-dependent receptor [candidate division KSB1 bacterium]|nr:TonB-dependent receptor [candidate division KSB1 bacterium]